MAKRTILSPSALQPHSTATSLPLSPRLTVPLSPSLVVHILLEMLMISPHCILMQGLSTLFPFIHIQMCSYCLFALGPFKMPFWNMPFDKHIIGQVPAVIRALFNVSKLESERVCSGAGSYPFSSVLTPWHLPGRWGGPSVGQDDPGPSLALRHCWPSSIFHLRMEIKHRRNDTGESPSQRRVLYAGRLDSCTLSQECDRRTAL